MFKNSGDSQLQITLETTAGADVKELIKGRIEGALQKEIDNCSKEYFRTIQATVNITLD